MRYAPYDKYGRYEYTFTRRFTQPLYRYVVVPPECDDGAYILMFEPQEFPLDRFFDKAAPSQGDVLELATLDKRVVFQGVQVEVVEPVAGISITPLMNTPTAFDTIDCAVATKQTYLPQGGVLDSATNLTDTQFIIDNPDYFGIHLTTLGGNLEDLRLRITLVVNEQFDATLPVNADQVQP